MTEAPLNSFSGFLVEEGLWLYEAPSPPSALNPFGPKK